MKTSNLVDKHLLNFIKNFNLICIFSACIHFLDRRSQVGVYGKDLSVKKLIVVGLLKI